jgi:hypothetical protein
MNPQSIVIVLAIVMSLALTSSPGLADDTTVLLEHFAYGNTNATVEFKSSNDSYPSELLIDIPRGAAIIDANVSVSGTEGAGMASTRMDFSTHAVGPGLWARHNESTGIYEPDVDPHNNSWSAMPTAQVANVTSVDGKYWHTQTPTAPTTAPWEYTIQLFHFTVDTENAVMHNISWRGHGKCLGNNTFTKYHAEIWIYDHVDNEWYHPGSYWDWLPDDQWMNISISSGEVYISTNGSIDVAIVGNHAEVNNSVAPAVSDYGHLYTDYIGLVTHHSSASNEYPKDVTLEVFGNYLRVKDGPLTETVEVGDGLGFKTALQSHIDSYPQKPGNVTLSIGVLVKWPTFSKVEVSNLSILYDSTGVIPNDPPEWVGPSEVDVMEDSPWTPVMNMDQAFTDDYDPDDLQFNIVDISHDGVLNGRLREGLLGRTWLELKAIDDYYGDVEVTVSAADTTGLTTEAPPLTVHVEQVPDSPILVTMGAVSINESEPLNLTLTVLDPDMPDDSYTFSDTSDVFDVHPTLGTIDWTPTADDVGTHTCMVTVQDSYGLTDAATLIVEVKDVNHPPSITSANVIDTLEGQLVTYRITAEDEDLPQGDTLTFTAWSVDVEVQVDASTGDLTLTPDDGFIGEILVFMKVTDSFGIYEQSTLKVRVANVNGPPTIEQISSLKYDEGDRVSVHLSFDDPDLWQDLDEPEVLTFTTDGPAWLTADDNGWVNLTVDQTMVGQYAVGYTVTDSGGLSANVDVLWNLVNINDGPEIITFVPATVEAIEDQPFTLAIEGTDIDGDTLSWTDDTHLFTIGPNSGVITFTPSQTDIGTHRVIVTVSDGHGGTDSVAFDLVVENVNDAPIIVTVEPTNGTRFKEGKLVRFFVEATDEDGDALTYTWSEGGIELGGGSPLLIKDLALGHHTITLTVTDGDATTDQTLTVQISKVDTTDGGGDLAMVLIIVAVVAVVGVAMALYLRSRKEG